MKLYFLLPLLLGAMLASCVMGPRRHYVLETVPPQSLAGITYDVEAYQQKYDGHDGVFILSDDLLEHVSGGQTWNAYRISSLRFMILNPDAEWLTTFSVRTNSNRELLNAYINVISPDGTVKSFTKKDMKVEKDSEGSTIYRFAYPDVQVGTVVDEGYEIKYRVGASVSRYEFPLQFDVPCEKVKVKYAYPDFFRIKAKKVGPDKRIELSPDNSIIGVKAYSYEAEDVPAFADEPYSPYQKEMSDYLDIAVTGAYSTTFLPSWDDFADGFKSYALERESFWRDRVKNILEEIVTDDMSDFEKVDAINSWLQQNIEIEDVPSDFSFNDVIKEKKGEPILITGLGRLMLEKVGIDADFVLIHSAEDGYFDQDFVTYGTLTTPAIHTKIDGKEYVLFPYIKNFPIDHIPEYIQGQRAIRINGDGFNGFITIPNGSLARNTVTESYNLTIDEDGLISVSEEKELRGTTAYAVRRLLDRASEEEVEEAMKELLTYEEGDVSLKSYDIEDREDYRKPLVIKLRYEIDNLVTITPEEVIMQTAGLLSPSSNRKTKVDSDKRVNPIRVYNDERVVKKITINHPTSWQLSVVPENVSYENRFGEIEAEYKTSSGHVDIALSRTLYSISEPAEQFTEMLNIVGRRSRYLEVPTLIFANSGFGE
ncbi:MAG: transglutaminase domain-containing protein [Ignavibacteriae bacterium]|nr:transglutaminase domain-containing protein [Ignavibacteriota bacterium]MCB9216560.1 transglutaminase domain-containing protein [Ignavibacteria bacterium]